MDEGNSSLHEFSRRRQNQTYRPNRPLTHLDETQSYLCPLPRPHISEEDTLVYFKLYDPEKLQSRYVGSHSVRSSGNPTKIIAFEMRKPGPQITTPLQREREREREDGSNENNYLNLKTRKQIWATYFSC
ncbi:hypothetical protein LXL04_022423 [Taraxacum kok-saghyz]